jgi:hypothetical protein
MHMRTASPTHRILSLVILVTFTICASAHPGLAQAQAQTTVPAGTPVILEFVSGIDPTMVTPGQTVSLRAVSDVVVSGVTVIAAGAAATGEVTVAEKRAAIGKPAKIAIIVRSVDAVDGTKIPVTGQSSREGENKQTESLVIAILCCILALVIKGGEAEIPAGTTITVQTLGSVQIGG